MTIIKGSTKKISPEEYEKKFKEKSNGEFTLMDKYKNSRTDIKIKHNKCKTEYKINPRHFARRGFECKECSPKITSEEKFIAKLKDIYGNEMELISAYKNTRTKVKVLHKPCNYVREVLPSTVLRNECPKCAGSLKKTTKQFKEDMNKIVGKEYSLLNEYKGTEHFIKLKHEKCGHIYQVKAGSFLHGKTRCPKCAESKGEKRISTFLDENKIKYKTEQTFPDLKGKGKISLRFDFAVLNKKGSLCCLIEYDGAFHYRESKLTNLKEIQKRDQKKDDYCEQNNIKLLRIPYWDFDNIEEILTSKLLKTQGELL